MTATPLPQRSPLRCFRCAGCGYGATCRRKPATCPICRGSDWTEEVRVPSPYDHLDDASAPLARDGTGLPGVPFS
jgi:hypothetical protein